MFDRTKGQLISKEKIFVFLPYLSKIGKIKKIQIIILEDK